jgi:hypothetical protein
MHSASLWTAVFGLGASVAALDPVEAYGNKFFNKDGSQFFMKGELCGKGRHHFVLRC